MDPKEVLAFLSRRRSVRRYQGKIIPEELLELVMKAAMAAPSGNNAQPWEFVIVRDKALKEKISRVHPWVHMAAEAPAAIVVLGDKSSKWWEHDCAAAAEKVRDHRRAGSGGAEAPEYLRTAWGPLHRSHRLSRRIPLPPYEIPQR
ncbi:MAG: nitroreductase family protein [Deltaproteobacteria bacterium]|nr:nitroreductase family protein [Deltaproteobacteria bacterium]